MPSQGMCGEGVGDATTLTAVVRLYRRRGRTLAVEMKEGREGVKRLLFPKGFTVQPVAGSGAVKLNPSGMSRLQPLRPSTPSPQHTHALPVTHA